MAAPASTSALTIANEANLLLAIAALAFTSALTISKAANLVLAIAASDLTSALTIEPSFIPPELTVVSAVSYTHLTLPTKRIV